MNQFFLYLLVLMVGVLGETELINTYTSIGEPKVFYSTEDTETATEINTYKPTAGVKLFILSDDIIESEKTYKSIAGVKVVYLTDDTETTNEINTYTSIAGAKVFFVSDTIETEPPIPNQQSDVPASTNINSPVNTNTKLTTNTIYTIATTPNLDEPINPNKVQYASNLKKLINQKDPVEYHNVITYTSEVPTAIISDGKTFVASTLVVDTSFIPNNTPFSIAPAVTTVNHQGSACGITASMFMICISFIGMLV